MTKPIQKTTKPDASADKEAESASNMGNPSRAPQVIAGDKATAPDVLPPKTTEGAQPAKP